MSNSWIDSGDGTGIYCDADADNNLLQLKLKKPKAWKWELTTSRSSPNIAMPRIMLFNHKGDLLVDANQQVDDAVYRAENKAAKRKAKKQLRARTTNLERIPQDDEDTGLGSLDSAEKQNYKPLKNGDFFFYEKSINSRNLPEVEVETDINGYSSWKNSIADELDLGSLQICEVTDSDRSPQRSPIEYEKSASQAEEDVNINTPWRRKLSQKEKSIEPQKTWSDFDNSPDRLYISKASWKPFHSNGHLDATQPVEKPFERRASSFKEVRFKVHPASDDEEHKPREKRRYRRSNTNGRPPLTHSGSILERLSAMKCRLSSPEMETVRTHELQMGPRYFLRTSRAGTIVVAEENYKQRRIRRRPPKTSSTENVLSPSSSSLKRNPLPKQTGLLGANLGVPCTQSQSMNNFGELNGNRQRRKVIPIRRHKSDGNILLGSSSDEAKHENRSRISGSVKHRKNRSWRQNQGNARNQTELIGS